MHEFSLPEGMSFPDFRKHPVREAIADAAHHGRRGLPSEAELDALKLSPYLRARVKEACQVYAEIHDSGEQKLAWDCADEESAWVLERLPAEQRDLSFYAPEQVAETSDPRELAARVRAAQGRSV
jgi:hypothetical protein